MSNAGTTGFGGPVGLLKSSVSAFRFVAKKLRAETQEMIFNP